MFSSIKGEEFVKQLRNHQLLKNSMKQFFITDGTIIIQYRYLITLKSMI